MRPLLRSPAVLVLVLALLSAFALLGSRGIWDPDEGRYTNVALNMLDTGNWLEPRRSHEVAHWTKPPLTYWAIASSVAVFGRNAWAARLPGALAFLLCTWLAWRVARRLAPGAEAQAAVIYATMLLTVFASQLITTDYVLAACIGVAGHGFVEARFAERPHPRRWIALMWVGLGLGFLTKGPPALLVLPAFLLFDLLMPARRAHRMFDVVGVLVFIALALPWYAAVVIETPGLFHYFIGDEVINRVTTDEFGRHGEWYGWLEIYLPTLLLGSLPWTPALLRWARALPSSIHRWRSVDARADDAPQLLLALWLLVPLLVFCLAQSRMPLYILPMFLPLAVLAARQRHGEGRGLPRLRWLAAWAIVLLALKLGTVLWPTHKDAARWAAEIQARVGGAVSEVIFVEDMARYGLHLHTGAEIEKIALALPQPQPRFNPEFDEEIASELAENDADAIWICRQSQWPQVRDRIAALGRRAVPLGAPYEHRIIFRVAPASAETAP